jgi:uncharacterized damage-inducible protein DinB
MIDGADVVRMARYDRWQSQNLSGAADRLPGSERGRERGAFCGPIHAAFNHLLWGDGMWTNRLAGTPRLAVRPFNLFMPE